MSTFYGEYPPLGSSGGGGSGITSINGDTTAAQVIAAGTGISVASVAGTTTITNSSPAPATGNLTAAGTDGIAITSGTGAVVGAGTSIAQHVADSTHNGYLTSTDWSTFNNKAPTASPVFTSSVTFGNYKMQPSENNAGNSSTAITIDWTNGSAQLVTLTGNVTFTLSNPQTGGAYILRLATGAGSFTATWPAAVHWSGGTAPTITTTASKFDLINLYYDGSVYYGSFTQNYS